MGVILGILFLVIPLSVTAQGDSLLEKFFQGIKENRMEVTYSYSARVSGIMNNGKGTLASQDAMWTVVGNGVEMYCDSKTLWVVDPSMKEVVIEQASAGTSSGFLDNPALLFSRLEDNFKMTASRWLEEGKYRLYTFRPKSDMGLDYFNLEIERSDASVRSASFAMTDGTYVKIEVSSMKLTPKVSATVFRPAVVFDAEWIVTDLR